MHARPKTCRRWRAVSDRVCWTELLLTQPQDSLIPLLKTIVYSRSWVSKLVNKPGIDQNTALLAQSASNLNDVWQKQVKSYFSFDDVGLTQLWLSSVDWSLISQEPINRSHLSLVFSFDLFPRKYMDSNVLWACVLVGNAAALWSKKLKLDLPFSI